MAFWKKRKSKFKNVVEKGPCGYTHRSKLEVAVCNLYQSNITNHEVSVRLGPDNWRYVADFQCKDELGSIYYVEAKGVEGARWKITMKMWEKYGPAPLYIYKGTHKYPKLWKIIPAAPPVEETRTFYIQMNYCKSEWIVTLDEPEQKNGWIICKEVTS